MLYYHLYIMHKVGRYPRNVSKLLGRAIFRPQNSRLECWWAIARGLFDGAFGRLGIRYPVSSMRERDLSSSRSSSGVRQERATTEPRQRRRGGNAAPSEKLGCKGFSSKVLRVSPVASPVTD